MKRILSTLLMLLFLSTLVWGQSSSGAKLIYPKRYKLSEPLRDLAKPAPDWTPGIQRREVPNRLTDQSEPSASQPGGDPALQTSYPSGPAATTLANFEGVDNLCNCAPPDPNGDVGPSHVFETVNWHFQIWDKSGTSLVGPSVLGDLWDGFGGGCEFNNDGDPVVLYDNVNDRWMASQFVFSTSQCIAVSTTGDPTDSYHLFEFSTPGNDYPKMGLMDDVYYGTIRNFSGPFNLDAVAWNGAKLRAGDPTAEMVIRDMTALFPIGIDGFLPADLDGPAPPGGTPGFFGGAAGNKRFVILEMDPDFVTPANTTLAITAPLLVNQFDKSISTVPQPAPGGGLDALAFATLHRLAFRDFGPGQHFAMVANHTVDVGGNQAGVRWYEFRDDSRAGNNWQVHQQSTYSPDSDHRWMGSIAMNDDGDIGLSFTVSSSSTFPSIRFTGREAGDPLNQMTLPEGTIIAGTGSQTGTSRWGDYSSISVDPDDGETFWAVHEYVQTTGSFNWQTRIGQFEVTGGAPVADVDVVITPVSPPITIPPGGGSYQYDIDATEIGGAPVTFTLEGGVRTPGGAEFILFGPLSVSLTAGGTFNSGTQTQVIPAQVPPNTYTQFARAVGFDEGSFTWTKTTSPSAAKTVAANDNSWSLPHAENGQPVYAARAGGDQNEKIASESLPETVALEQNYPNPFNPSTAIRYTLNQGTTVKLSIYNGLGQLITTLVDGYQSAGSQTASWDGTNSLGQPVAAGVYVYRLQAGDVVKTNKMTFVK